MAALAIVQSSSLAARLQEVEAIASTLEMLDHTDELSHEEYAALQEQLITSICGTKEKIDRTASVLAELDAQAEAAAKEAARLAARRARYEGQAERLRTYVLMVLETSNLPKLEGFTSTLARRMNPERVEIDDADALPSTFYRFPKQPPPAPDKTAIAAELKRGIEVPGARLVRTARLVVS